MQGPPTPTEDDKASIQPEHVRNGPFLSAGRRKAANRTLLRDLKADEIQLTLPPPEGEGEDDEDTRTTKKQRLEKPFSTSTDKATTENTSHGTAVALPSPAAADTDADHHHHADSDRVMHMHPNMRTHRWTLEEDKNLTNAVKNTCKKKYGKELRIDWVAVTALVSGRTKVQCCNRWRDALDPSIGRTTARAGQWTADEDKMLKDALPTNGAKSWEAIAALVPGRTNGQCRYRWHNTLVSNIDATTARAGKWTADEDKKLKDAVLAHGGKNWGEIAALVPGRTKSQCSSRWHVALDPSIGRTTARTDKWTADEDMMLQNVVLTHGGENWEAIAALVPGRTKVQCRNRWHDALNPSIDRTNGRTGKWTADEDKKLKDAVLAHGGENWEAIAALVPGRTKVQCRNRWHKAKTRF
jgi:hypothetical protein